MQEAVYKRKLPPIPPSPREQPQKKFVLDGSLSWEEEFFADCQSISDRTWTADVDTEPLQFDDSSLEMVRPLNYPPPGAPAQVWLARRENRLYAVKLFRPYTDEEARGQALRLRKRKPSLQKVRHDVSPFALETRAYERIRKFLPAHQQSFFRRYHGTFEVSPSRLDRRFSGTSFRHGIVFDVLTTKLRGRHLYSGRDVGDFAPHVEALQADLAKLDLSPLEERWYLSVLNERLTKVTAAHTLGILHGDIKFDCFGLPQSPHDIVLHDFSRAYTFTRERPCAMTGMVRLRSLKHAADVERDHIRICVLDMAKSAHLFDHFKQLLGMTEGDARKVLSSSIPRSLLATELALIILSVRMIDDGLFSLKVVL
ncbi:hypothetical protein AYO20_01621 [Fonsecaea nubica]|uniref:Protein kinase domain-containing protein n=1 Tax=Fonsecaea nubica TaxID=856822 RepID=A0A178D9F6_9EURO|nr:hypothetical protein AYO20_01621 [Fonsecaea nubica]OAL38870.1 hypothetical protein AYO20_01621 [Fonsecaea nubica]